MYDTIKITKIIKDIEEEFRNIDEFGLSEKSDSKTFYASSMVFMVVISRAIDLAEEIIMKNDFGMPQRYKDYFTLLVERGLLDKRIGQELGKLAEWRNTFAHEYFNIKKSEIIKIKKDIYYIKDFIERIKKIVIKEGKK